MGVAFYAKSPNQPTIYILFILLFSTSPIFFLVVCIEYQIQGVLSFPPCVLISFFFLFFIFDFLTTFDVLTHTLLCLL